MIAWKEGEKKVGNGKGKEEILRVIGWRRGRRMENCMIPPSLHGPPFSLFSTWRQRSYRQEKECVSTVNSYGTNYISSSNSKFS